MKDTRIEDLAKTIMQATNVKEVIDGNGGRMSVGSNRLHLSVTDDVDIIIETDMGRCMMCGFKTIPRERAVPSPRRQT